MAHQIAKLCGVGPHGLQRGRHVFAQTLGQVRNKHATNKRRPHRAADLAEEVIGCSSGADHRDREGVLDDEHQDLHRSAQTETEHEQAHPDVDQAGTSLKLRQERQADGDNHETCDREPLVAAGSGDNVAHHDRGAHQARHHGDHHQARIGRRHGMHHLQVGRDVGERTKHENADEQTSDRGEREIAIRKQLHRDDRVRGFKLGKNKQCTKHSRTDAQQDDPGRAPRVLITAPGDQQDD